jgi:hypothetical protein
MWAPFVVVVGPFGDRRSGVIEAEEQGFVEELVAHAAVEALQRILNYALARIPRLAKVTDGARRPKIDPLPTPQTSPPAPAGFPPAPLKRDGDGSKNRIYSA